MAKLSILAGSTSQSVNLFIQDSSLTTGVGLSGLVYNSAGLTAYYTHSGTNATATAITLATLAAVNSAFSSGGFKEIDATNMPGVYRLDIPNAALASAKGQSVVILLKGATNMSPCVLEVELTAWNNQDSVRGGMTALPNAVAGASTGLIINGSNSGTATLAALTITGSFTISDGLLISRSSANTSAFTATGNGTGHGIVATSGSGATGNGINATAASTNGNGFNTTGTGTGAGTRYNGGATGNGLQVVGGATSGAGVLVTTTSGDGISSTPTAGHALNLTANGTTKHGINATGGATTSHGIVATGGGVGHGILATSGAGATGNGISAVAASTNGSGMTLTKTGSGSDLNATSTPLTLAKTTNITGFNDIAATAIVSSGAITTSGGAVSTVTAVSGSVGSVTGAVGSVTGNVGGNVTGSVGSVVGAVGSVTGLTASDVGAIKTQTDKFVFTVANQVNANIQYVNDVLVTGDGQSGTEWGP